MVISHDSRVAISHATIKKTVSKAVINHVAAISNKEVTNPEAISHEVVISLASKVVINPITIPRTTSRAVISHKAVTNHAATSPEVGINLVAAISRRAAINPVSRAVISHVAAIHSHPEEATVPVREKWVRPKSKTVLRNVWNTMKAISTRTSRFA